VKNYGNCKKEILSYEAKPEENKSFFLQKDLGQDVEDLEEREKNKIIILRKQDHIFLYYHNMYNNISTTL